MADICEATPGCKGYVPYGLNREGKYVPAYTVDGKPSCAGCYYEALGKEMEEHPIGRHLPLRGCH
jgi:hypothetical protein